MDVRDGPQRRLSTEELMLLNCRVGEDLRAPWTAKRSNPEYSLEGLMLKLKLQCFDPPMRRANSSVKILMLGKTEGRKGTTEDEMVGWHHRLNGHEFKQAPRDSE